MSMNPELARNNMVENQVRTWEVLDARVLEVLGSVRREDFVPERYRATAFADIELPIGHGEYMMKPVIEGRTLQALALESGQSVLEIGTGSGFLTACLARLGGQVTSVEQHADLADAARARLAHAGVTNARVDTAEALLAYEPRERFDVVVLTGAVYALPDRVRAWVKPGGRLFAISGESPAMQAMLHTRIDDTRWQSESLFETDIPYLGNATPPRRFSL
ncbi:protein-L-isoaspartate O-methyltransferase family protein [Dokdonella sp. MW10]|uniref:protein-L-isoaspartate O-methyltransferase family protein n=1 Tax=Dokdonella sp. MW10 TaxID=2992926 RepID=UPI003F81DE73